MRLIFFGAGYCSNFIIPLIGKKMEIICTHKNKIKIQSFDKNFQIKRMLFDEFFDNSHELLNSSKDTSRTKVIEMYPSLSSQLSKKKDVNKTDAILIARFYYETSLKVEN